MPEETEEEAAAHLAFNSAIFSKAPPLAIPAGFKMLSEPPKLTMGGMKNLKIMHVFTSGWFQGTWRQGKTALGYYRVHYLDDGVGAKTGMNWEQSLLVSDYGPDKKWIAIKKMTKSEQKEAQKGVEQEVEQQEQGASSSTDALEVMATPEPMSVEGSGAASSSSGASSSNQKRIAELSDEE